VNKNDLNIVNCKQQQNLRETKRRQQNTTESKSHIKSYSSNLDHPFILK